MDGQLEFSSQAFSKMIMHAMKYPHSVCCGLLLSPKPRSESEADSDDQANLENAGDANSADGQQHQQQQQPIRTNRIIDAIPISHTSHYLAPNNEVALNSVSIFAQEQELIISGYYQTDRYSEHTCIDAFGQKVTETIAEAYPNAVLCFVSFEAPMARAVLDLLHLVDGKWRRRPAHSFSIENDPDVLANTVLYSKEKLYRKIVDFDDHFDNISLDWTNAKISQRIDYLVANIC
jgi:hypothetical protein